MLKLAIILSLVFCAVVSGFLGLVELRDHPLYQEISDTFFYIVNLYFKSTIWFFVLANLFYLVILVLGFINARRQYVDQLVGINKKLTPLKSLKPISILVPCYNEETTVADSLQSMLLLDYPSYEVIVCSDGSTDSTMQTLFEEFALTEIESYPPQTLPSKKIIKVYRSEQYRNLVVIDKENGGKSDALNAAINFSQYSLICCVDSDSIIDRDGLLNVSMPFLESSDVIATGGTILLANTEKKEGSKQNQMVNTDITFSWMGMIQSVEYLRAFFVGRLGWDYLGCDTIISGAFGLFKKSLVIKVGGYANNTIGEDMELLIRMQSYCKSHNEGYDIRILPIPVCWTEPPTDLKTLGNQRTRWAQGLIESIWRHKDMLFRRWAGSLGMVGLPYYLFFELLSAPLEIIGYLISYVGLGLGVFTWNTVLAFLAATMLFGTLLNLGAVIIDQKTFEKYDKNSDVLKLIAGSFLEHLGFRQLHLYWRMRGIYRWIRGKQSWGEMKRVGIK